MFKSELCFEDYLKFDFPEKWLLIRLRAGLFRVAANEGRWSVPPVPYDQRICPICNDIVVESEVHFMFDCRPYSTFRLFLNGKYPMYGQRDVKSVMNCAEVSFLKDFARFLRTAFDLRMEALTFG